MQGHIRRTNNNKMEWEAVLSIKILLMYSLWNVNCQYTCSIDNYLVKLLTNLVFKQKK